MKTYYFIAGLHRSGATLLSSILNQNPRFYSGPLSPVLNIIQNLEGFISEQEFYLASPKPLQVHKLLSSVIHNYHDDIDKPVIFDKNRLWTKQINYIEEYVGQRAKIICPVRDISEILTSFLTLIHKTESKEDFNTIDREVISSGLSLNDYNRCNMILNGFIKDALDSLRFPFENNLLDRILIVEYKDLVLSPTKSFKKIYNFLGEEYFEHDFNHIQNVNLVKDCEYYHFPGLHDVRESLNFQSEDPEKILHEDILDRCKDLQFWRNFLCI